MSASRSTTSARRSSAKATRPRFAATSSTLRAARRASGTITVASTRVSIFQTLKGYADPELADQGVSVADVLQRTIKATSFSNATYLLLDLEGVDTEPDILDDGKKGPWTIFATADCEAQFKAK
eukprot:scaffold109_cov127-Isochrysis_galbana.AAC.1